MTIKKSVKHSIRLLIESDGSVYTMVIRASKLQLIAALDRLLPDDAEVKV